ncbi:MAG TPA: copper amine oxidase N-terminal domain-containing protein [Epulopiscium sp.]|nr:copper amine oxidase N-terminal domain-containing protein [Candidatus Epulonipiscium sp.]
MSISKKRTSIMLFALVGVIITSNVGTVVYAAEATATAPSAKVLEVIKKASPVNVTSAKPAPNIKITVNGKAATLKDPIVMENGRVFLPVRNLGELLGVNVDYQAANKVATAQNSNAYLELPLGYNEAVKNKTIVLPIDTANKSTRIITYNNRTYLPVRFISENLGYQISYANNTVAITTDGTTPTTPTVPTTPTTPTTPADGQFSDVSQMNPADKDNPHNLIAFSEGRSLSQIPTVPFSQITKPAGMTDAQWNKMKELHGPSKLGFVLASGKISDMPKDILRMYDGKEENNKGITGVTKITVNPDSISATSSPINTLFVFKDGTHQYVDRGKTFKGKTLNDVLFIDFYDVGNGSYIFFPTGN